MADGTAVTFYSYKGGVGRTLALANVAAALAGWGYRVLCVDWDLEAPGLSRYFHPWIEVPSAGLVDLMEEVAAGEPPNLQRATVTVAAPGLEDRLALIPAGRQDDNFVSRVQGINWSDLYENHELGLVLEQMRSDWLRQFDFLLIDSRTGITDIGGICTVQLPDILVVMFGANYQSLDGAIEVAQRAIKARQSLPYDRARLLILPIPSRFDAREEYDRAMRWQHIFSERLSQFYSDWAVKETAPGQLIERTTIPYFARWSFGEELPIVTEKMRGPDFISYHLETLAALVAHRLARSDLLVESTESYIDAAQRAGLRGGRFEYDVFISYSRGTRQVAQKLTDQLRSFAVRVFLEEENAVLGGDWTAESDRKLAQSQHLAVVVGPEMSRWQRREVERFIKQTVDEGSERSVFPILVGDATARALPSLLQHTQDYDTRQRPIRRIATDIALAVLSGVSASDLSHSPTALDKLAGVLRGQENLDGARTLYERALAIRETQLGPDNPDTAISLRNLASVLYLQGDLDGARTLLERALTIFENRLGPDDLDTAITLNNLAGVLRAQGDLDGARTLYERALAIRETQLGPDNPDTAISLRNLANVLRAQGDLDGARTLLERALAIREAHLGRSHPLTAQSLDDLAGVLRAQGDLDGARTLLERALTIREARLGSDNPDTAISLRNLANVLRAQGDLDGARTLLERALAIREAHLGRSHPLTAQSLDDLAGVLRAQGDLDGARTLLERALTIREARLGPDNPDTAITLTELARVLLAQENLDGARTLLERALTIREARLGPARLKNTLSREQLAAVVEALAKRA
jgi:tetratricopeptide (TPR) repeat protein